MPYTIQDFLQAKAAHSPSFSADGKQIAYLSNLSGTFQVYIQSAEGGEARQVTDFDDSVSLIKFSPTDPDLLLFARDSGGNEMHQLYMLDLESGAIRSITDSPNAQHNFGDWYPTGQEVVYTSTKRNGIDYDVYGFDLQTGEEWMAASLGGYCSVVSLSPSWHWLVVSKARGSFLDTELYLFDLGADTPPKLLTPHEKTALYSKAEWLPDESGFYTISDDDADTAGVRFVSISEGRAVDVLPSEWPVEDIAISPDGNWLAVATNNDGWSALKVYSVNAGFPEALQNQNPKLAQAQGIVGGLNWDRRSAMLAFARSDYAAPFTVWTLALNRDTWQVTQLPAVVPISAMVEPNLIHYISFDGLSIPAFVFMPNHKHADAKIPAVIYIHGGPEGQFRPSFNPVIQYFASQGYAVIAPNVRGSDGYGKAYLALDDRHKRLDSVRDLEGLYRWIEADGRIDPKRVALMGGSYGGYMVLAGLAFQPELWAAGVDIVGIANLVSFLENTSPYRRAVREAEYGYLATDREFLASASPINKAGDIRAPLFIIHGANDPRVPLSEAEQMRDTLAARGVAAELLVYADEGHGLAKLKNRLDAYPKVAAFLADVFER